MTTTQAFTLSHNLAFVQHIQHKLYRVGKDKWNVVIIGENK